MLRGILGKLLKKSRRSQWAWQGHALFYGITKVRRTGLLLVLIIPDYILRLNGLIILLSFFGVTWCSGVTWCFLPLHGVLKFGSTFDVLC